MTEVVDFAARRWKERTGPQQHAIRDMLVEALRALDAGEFKPDHAILVHASEDDDASNTGWFQAGKFGGFAQIGLMHDVARIMGNEG